MAFKMRSGNKPGFKKMGATEAIKQVDTEKAAKGKGSEREIYKAKLRGDYMDLTGDKLKKASYDDHPEELIKGHSIPESPAKQYKKQVGPIEKEKTKSVEEYNKSIEEHNVKARMHNVKEFADRKKHGKYRDPQMMRMQRPLRTPPTPSPAKQKKDDSYDKKKEQLLNQGFSQVEADQMIKEGGVTGEGKVVHTMTIADAMKDPKWRKKMKEFKKSQKRKK